MKMTPERIPVIVGVGEVSERPADPLTSREPVDLMLDALRQADADGGGHWLGRVQTIAIVNQMGWRYPDIASSLASRLTPRPHVAEGPVGGESPLRLIHEAALRVARGEVETAAVCGAEAQYAIDKARAAGLELPWTPQAPAADRSHLWAYHNPLALAHRVIAPAHVYPFYEAATAAAWGQTPREALAESAAIYARLSATAAREPNAWSTRAYTADEIATPAPDNRLIAWPYTKRMVANPSVNMGAAVIVTSLAAARSAGVREDDLVFFGGGAAATEPRDYLQRGRYDRSAAQEAVLSRARRLNGEDAFGAVELYSCFPVVPKMARRVLGLAADTELSVIGGLSFFGAAINNYMTHAAVGMVRRLRDGTSTGLLYGQGEYVTKHHALLLRRTPGRADNLLAGYDVQADADAAMGTAPPTVEGFEGPLTVEASTVLYDREGQPSAGIVIGRTPHGGRTMARVDAADTTTIAVLTDGSRSAVGRTGSAECGPDGLSRWRV
jgi:acetyl-CoA C-acetyltransferase